MADLEAFLAPPRCEPAALNGGQSLVDVYGLRDFANSVARQDPETGAKRKLRKSYKNHVADLPGKHPVPGRGECAWQLMDAALVPPPAGVAEALRSLTYDAEALARLRLQRVGPVPGFDPRLLAAPGPNPRNPGDPSSPTPTEAASPAAGASPDDRREKRKRRDAAAAGKKRKM